MKKELVKFPIEFGRLDGDHNCPNCGSGTNVNFGGGVVIEYCPECGWEQELSSDVEEPLTSNK